MSDSKGPILLENDLEFIIIIIIIIIIRGSLRFLCKKN